MNKAIHEAIDIIFGGKSGGYYLAGMFISFLAILLSIWVHSLTRDAASPNTPVTFKWSFLLWDNLKRMVAGLIAMFLFFRAFDLSNIFAMIGLGFSVGFGLDKMIQVLIEKTNVLNFLQTDRSNFKDKS